MNTLTHYSLILFCLVFVQAQQLTAQTTWQKKTAPLMTTWGETLTPDNVLNEYPRPQMVRDNWENLNGIWDFAKTTQNRIGTYQANQTYHQKILVPFPVESALSGVMDADYTNKDKAYVYKRTFTVPATMKGKQLLLHFGAVDWRSYVYVNGKLVGKHEGGFDPFYYDITDKLLATGEQELVVQVYDPTEGGQPRGKQNMTPGGIFYTPSTGIWQTVWLEAVNTTYINDFTLTPDIDKRAINVKVTAKNAQTTTQVEVTISDGKTVVAKKTLDLNKETAITISNPKLWSPDSPFLYDVTFKLLTGSEVNDVVDSYFGMRKIALGELRGKPYLMLNNEPVFHYGPLDQGYWPDGLFTPPSYEALRFDLEKTKELGFNMTRKHLKVEPAKFYHYCDSIGLMVWQDMPNTTNLYNWMGNMFTTAKAIQDNYYRELQLMVNALKNYPSVVVWVPFNEGGGQFGDNINHTKAAVDIIRKLDQSRLIDAVSGWTDYEVGDMIDRHHYTEPYLHNNPVNKRANVCGETGGYSLEIKGHIWGKIDDTYKILKDKDELSTWLEYLHKHALSFTADGMCGLVYTQITDVEEEINGLYTYDRKELKKTPAQVARFKAGAAKLQSKAARSVIPISYQSINKVMWKYKTGAFGFNPGDGWEKNKNFNDASWAEGQSGFGNGTIPYIDKINTTWTDGSICMRKVVTFDADMTAEEINSLKLFVYFDDNIDVYINGVLAYSEGGFLSMYKTVEVSQAAKNSIKPGQENLIAVRCNQAFGGQFIDVGLYYDIPLRKGFMGTDIDKVATNASQQKALNVYNSPEGLVLECDRPASVWIYDLRATLITHFYMERRKELALSKGVYMVTSLANGNRESQKVFKF